MDDETIPKDNPLLYWFFIVVGILLIVISFLLSYSYSILEAINKPFADFSLVLNNVSLNVGASLITTAGVAYIYQRFGTNRLSFYLEKLLGSVSITQKAVDLGIENLWRERRHIPNDMWNTFTKAATSEVWLLGMAELGFAEDPKFAQIVSDGTAKGCNYRFLLLNPDSDATKKVDEYEGGTGQLQGRIRLSLQKFSEMRTKNSKKKGKVEIRIHDNVPQVSIIRSDDEFLITPYMYYRTGNSSFTLLVRKTPNGISDHYLSFFTAVWDKAQPL